MSDAPATLQIDAAAWKQAALRRQSALLEQIAEAGVRLALTIEAEAAQAAAAGQPVREDAAMTFSRVARAVRMTALLQSRLIQQMDLRDALHGPKALAAAAEAEERADPAYGHKARVEHIVARVAKAHTDDEDRLDRLLTEAAERLDDDDIYGDVLSRPVGELVSLICRDLGLDPDWTRLAEEAWAKAEIESGAEGSPFRGLLLDGGGQAEARFAPAFHGSS